MSSTQEQINRGAKDICFTIKTALENDDGALIGRNGTIELDCMINSLNAMKLLTLERNAGVFPLTDTVTFYKWRDASIEATQYANTLATGWYEPLKEAEAEALTCWGAMPIKIPLRSLEPYYADPNFQWTHLLSGHKVAVVSSFTKTSANQVGNLSKIWPATGKFTVPSDINWVWVQTGHPPSVAKGYNEWPAHVHSWSQAVDHVVLEVIRSGARFALIGCGGIGMIIAKRLKDCGVISIVLGGAIQVLFGIKGARWASHDIISKFWNDAWVWPSEDETPAGGTLIEGGCYWKP